MLYSNLNFHYFYTIMILSSDVHVLFKNIFKTQNEASKKPFEKGYITNYSSVDMGIFIQLPRGPLQLKRKIYQSNDQ